MYASNLEQLLFYCSERSDVSEQLPADFIDRFNSLRDYGHLPKGRDQRARLLTSRQIATAILGLVPTRPSWAGHGATVLKTLSPVGGQNGSFYGTASLADALTLLLEDTAARDSLTAVRIILGETGVNSTGGAEITYQQAGARKRAFFMPRAAISLAREGAELVFDIEEHLMSLASREMRFNRAFFSKIANAVELAAIRPGKPIGDASEYEGEEAKQALWRKLKVQPNSDFLNLAADNHVTWPREPTLVAFSGHHFVLFPRTKDYVQSVHIDLASNKLNVEAATTLVQRFLSILSWCDNNFATLGFGWSGSSVPSPVPKPELAFATAQDYFFDRRIPAEPKARRALALYREALNATHSGLISYAVLNYYKIIELTHDGRGPTKNWFRDNFEIVRSKEFLREALQDFDQLRGSVKEHEYIYTSCRIAVAHAGKHSESDPDDDNELQRLHVAARIMKTLACHHIASTFGISRSMSDGT